MIKALFFYLVLLSLTLVLNAMSVYALPVNDEPSNCSGILANHPNLNLLHFWTETKDVPKLQSAFSLVSNELTVTDQPGGVSFVQAVIAADHMIKILHLNHRLHDLGITRGMIAVSGEALRKKTAPNALNEILELKSGEEKTVFVLVENLLVALPEFSGLEFNHKATIPVIGRRSQREGVAIEVRGTKQALLYLFSLPRIRQFY